MMRREKQVRLKSLFVKTSEPDIKLYIRFLKVLPP